MNRTIAWAGVLALAALALAGTADAGSITYPSGGEYLSGTVTVTWVREVSSNAQMRLSLVVTGVEIEPPLCDPCTGSGTARSFTFDTTQYADSDEYMLQITETPTPNLGQGSIRYTTNSTFTIDNTEPATQAVLDGPTGSAGWYTGDVAVELIAADATAGVASTSVSVDGGAATTYAGSFRVTGDGSHTVLFQSTDRAGNQEAMRSVTFTIDATDPSTGAGVSGSAGSGGWYRGEVAVTLSAGDGTSGVASTFISIDGGRWTTIQAVPFPIGALQEIVPPEPGPPLGVVFVSSEGPHIIRFYSVDAAGNAEAVDSVAFRIDSAAPSTTVDVAGHEGFNDWYEGEVLVTLGPSDATSGVAETLASVDGGAAASYTGALRFTADGAHSVAFHSTDAAGNVEASRTVAFRIDATAPETGSAIAGTLGTNGWFIGPVTTTLSPGDATSGVAETLASVDGGAWAALGNSIAITADGDHTIRFYSVDAAGNAEAVDSVAFRIDATAPETTRDVAGHKGTNGWYTSDVVFTLASSDLTSGVAGTDFDVDGAGLGPYGGSVRVIGEGAHTVGYRATDLASNVEATKAFSFNIDTVAPVSAVTVGEPSTEAGRVVYVTSATPITLDAADATSGVDRIEFRLNEGGFETYTGTIRVLGEDGEYGLEWRAADAAGNVETAQFLRLFLDNTAPGLNLDRPQPGGLYVDGVLVVETHPLLVETSGLGIGDAATAADTIDFAVATGGLEVRVTAVDAAVGTQEARFLVDGVLRATDTEAPYTWTWDTAQETLGEHVLVVEVEDLLGNEDDRSLRVVTVPTAQEGIEKTLDGVQAGTDPVLPEEVRDLLAQLPGAPEPPALPPLPEPPALPGLPGPAGLPPLPEPPALPPLPV